MNYSYCNSCSLSGILNNVYMFIRYIFLIILKLFIECYLYLLMNYGLIGIRYIFPLSSNEYNVYKQGFRKKFMWES